MTLERFVDSSALFVWADRSSVQGQAIAAYMQGRHLSLVTTNLVFAETLSLVTKRVGKQYGIQLGEMLRSSVILRLSMIDATMQEEGWNLYKRHRDKDFDFIDATSFAYCRKHGIREVITLDRHFAQMGFAVLP